MRAHCSLIMPESGTESERTLGNKDFVIFMPYLHWESHKRRKQMAEVTREITSQHLKHSPRGTQVFQDALARTA
ncbi:hypothetical protein HYALB_00005532 [Hymenoscyphus albidus]|uniref:Uncharacterized protein n=1 Tax=Hymenoscyphus albidus TaxID=595503 RepID=A0A9N9Q301_9HELO|nr:hypothetical protein HYALB_00005532 [Hymenoscyphus albidus]